MRTEFLAQIQTLKDLDVSPQYLDGHHHIHIVPGLMDAISTSLHLHGIRKVRLPWDLGLWSTSQFPLLILSALARRRFKLLRLESLPCFYPPSKLLIRHTQFRGILRKRLLRTPEAELITHPAAHNDLGSLEFPESYQERRVDEFRSLQMLKPHPVGTIHV